jgi:hypothetical protein
MFLIIPIAKAYFIKTWAIDDPLRKVPPAGRGNRGSPREAGGTCRRGANVNSALAIGIRHALIPAGLVSEFQGG